MSSDRLNPLDVSFLYFDTRTTPMHAGGILVFDPDTAPRATEAGTRAATSEASGDSRDAATGGSEAGKAGEAGSAPPEPPDFDTVMDLLERRLTTVPRFRQKIKWVPGNVASPVWVDDAHFDLSYHVRRSALPRPGDMGQLRELAGRLMARPLDRTRPLWELYYVEGLEGGRVAVIGKTHHAMVDGLAAVDIMALLLDVSPQPREVESEHWQPSSEPGTVRMLTDAAADWIRRPAGITDALEVRALDVKAVASKLAGAATGLMSALGTVAAPPPSSPLNERTGSQRRVSTADTRLDDFRAVKKTLGGTVNDVVLAVCTNALRGWLLTRGEAVTPTTTLRAMVPVSVRDAGHQGAGGNFVASYFVDLPVGEPDPVAQLHRVSFAMRAHKEAGQQVGAQTLTTLAGFAPPTLHALGARVAISSTNRLFNLVITNVPGPQFPLYMAGARMVAMYPMVPLTAATSLAVGVTSYDGGVFFGLNADRDALPDVNVIAGLISESLHSLVEQIR
jgi:WS/DGAT/MGAT family acyltransferase